jgi:hypothetical protein
MNINFPARQIDAVDVATVIGLVRNNPQLIAHGWGWTGLPIQERRRKQGGGEQCDKDGEVEPSWKAGYVVSPGIRQKKRQRSARPSHGLLQSD